MAYLSHTLHDMTNKPGQSGNAVPPREAAAILGVSTRTIDRMAKQGKLHPLTLPSGHRRYLRSEVEALAQPQDPVAALAAEGERGNA